MQSSFGVNLASDGTSFVLATHTCSVLNRFKLIIAPYPVISALFLIPETESVVCVPAPMSFVYVASSSAYTFVKVTVPLVLPPTIVPVVFAF